jgi:hypothetical protein
MKKGKVVMGKVEMRSVNFVVVSLAVLASGVAVAQAPSRVGQVESVTGPEGSVLVVRGSETFFLAPGDALFNNDQVFTRSNGQASLTFTNCTVALPEAASVIVNSEVCAAPPLELSANDVVGGVEIGTGAGGVGATPAIVAGLAAAGGAAAAAGGDDGPASP